MFLLGLTNLSECKEILHTHEKAWNDSSSKNSNTSFSLHWNLVAVNSYVTVHYKWSPYCEILPGLPGSVQNSDKKRCRIKVNLERCLVVETTDTTPMIVTCWCQMGVTMQQQQLDRNKKIFSFYFIFHIHPPPMCYAQQLLWEQWKRREEAAYMLFSLFFQDKRHIK